MIRPSLRVLVLTMPLLISMGWFASIQAQDAAPAPEVTEPQAVSPAQPGTRSFGQPDLFYNYYVPGGPGGVPAAMYLAPRPVPPLVGHTYYTYQPLLPHEVMYPHQRRYYRYYNCGPGLTRTSVRFMRTPILDRLLP